MEELSGKLKLTTILIWLAVFYVLMWFIGGACTNIFTGGECISKGALAFMRGIPVLGWVIPFQAWNSVMYFFAPLAGFVLGFFALKWYNNYFETKEAASIIFAILILAALFGGYLINLSWYYGNLAVLNESNQTNIELYFCFDEPKCNSTVSALNQEMQQNPSQSGKITQYMAVNYWSELRESIYLTFMLGVLAAWLPFFAFSLHEKIKDEEE